MNEDEDNSSALTPYRVLDLSEGGCMIGPKLFGDLGADVIKIEPPGGSPSRIAPYYKDIPDPEKSLFWFAYNNNKRGITLALEKPASRELFKKLVLTADIIIESLGAGYLDRLGFGYADLDRIKPGIILSSISPYGQTGPKAGIKGSDLTAWAAGGFLYTCGDADRAPNWISFPQTSIIAGIEAATGAMTALWYRLATGEGQHVDVSMQECAMAPLWNFLQLWDVNKDNILRHGGRIYIGATGVCQTVCYPCQDGYVLILVQGGNEPLVGSTKRLVEWMDEEGMAEDWLKTVDFVTDYNAVALTAELAEKVEAAIAKFTATKTKSELFEEGGIKRRILLAPVSTIDDVCHSPQLQFRDYWKKVPHPELGETLTYCGPQFRLTETPLTYRRPAPLIGQHNGEIYGGELGLSTRELESSKRDGVI
jgi:benzylsuccinate CoA-transferase BbsE subunit